MSFLAPVGLFALGGVALVVGLHLFRRRMPERRVAGLFLWPARAVAAQAGRKRNPLLGSASLWCEILMAFLLAMLLGKLTFRSVEDAPHLVVVLDDSASMSASSGSTSVADAARSEVRKRLSSLTSAATVTIVTTGPRPEVVLGPRAPKELADGTLAHWAPRRARHDPLPALQLGSQFVVAEPDAALYITDRLPTDPKTVPGCFEVLALGTRLANRAIVAAKRLRGEDSTTERIFTDLMTFSEQAIETELVIVAEDSAGTELAKQTVQLLPGIVNHFGFSIPATKAGVRARLAPDSLRIDDEVLLLPEVPATVLTANLLPKETSAALRIEKLLMALPDVARAKSPADAHLLLVRGYGTLVPFTTELVIAPTPLDLDGTQSAPTSSRSLAHEDWIGPYLLEHRHPLLRGVTLDGVVWSSGPGDPPGQAIALAGDRVLIADESGTRGGRVVLNLDADRTNLAASPDWPVFFENLVARVRAHLPGARATNVHVGDRMLFHVGRESTTPKDLQFRDPSGRAWPARGSTLLAQEAREPGLWRLLAGDRELARWSAHFSDAVESSLLECSSGSQPVRERPASSESRGQSSSGRTEARILALLLLVVLGLDWWFLGRARSVG